MNLFDRLNYAIRNSEASLVNLLSAIAPWGAPLAPAYMSYQHMVNFLEFPQWVALSVGVVVEILGLSTIRTTLDFWSHNKRQRAEYKKSPVWIAIFAFLFYMLIVLVLNVMLDTSASAAALIASRALLTLLSVPAALILAVRAQHADLLSEISEQKAQKQKDSMKVAKVSESPGKVSDWRSLTERQKLQIAEMDVPEILQEYPISERTAYNWQRRLEDA